MKHCELLNIFVLFGVWTIAKAFRLPKIPQVPLPPPPPAFSQGAADYDNFLYPCYTSINCIYRGTDEHKRVEECVDFMDKHEWIRQIKLAEVINIDTQIALNFYNSSLKAEDYKDPYDTIDQTFCQVTSKERKKVFQTITAGAVQMNAMGCELRYRKSTCQHFRTFAECLVGLLTDMNEEGKCDIEEFEKKSS